MPPTPTHDKPPETRSRADSPARTDDGDSTAVRRRRRWTGERRFRPLPWKTRIAFWVVGVTLLILGVVGLFVPILQGVLFLVLAGAVLSLASESLYRWMRRRLVERFPEAWIRIERFRTRVRWRFRPRRGSKRRDDGDREAEGSTEEDDGRDGGS